MHDAANLTSAGGLYAARVPIEYPETQDELSALFADAARTGSALTLVGSRRSFGEHFLPEPGARGVSLEKIPRQVELLETTPEGDLWVRVSGATTFEELCRATPGHIPYHPPTGDRISIGGALAACSHDAVGYLATKVRAFTLLAPNGVVYTCIGDAKDDVTRELFRVVPGSFGALGAILSVELRLRHLVPGASAEINVLERCPTPGYLALERLEEHYQRGEYPLGRGLFFFGRGGESVLLGDRLIVPAPDDNAKTLLLTDDATERNIVAQALANRFPGIVHRLQPLVFDPGRRFRATLYGFSFYQRSYDRAHDYLASDSMAPRLLRWAGVDPWLRVCHQTFVVPVLERRRFLELYFRVFDSFPDLEGRLEQQDLIRLPECPFPLHGAHGMPGGAYLYTVSISIRRKGRSEQRSRAFLAEVSRRGYEAFGVKVLLLKQAHCDEALLRQMHRPFVERLSALKRNVDPSGVLGSRLLARLRVGRG